MRTPVITLLVALAAPLAAVHAEPHTVVSKLAAELRARYVFPERAEQAAQHLTVANDRGQFASATAPADLAAAIDTFLRNELHDQHLRIEYRAPSEEPKPGGPRKPTAERYRDYERAAAERENAGVRMAAQLDGNVGYLRISGFPDAAVLAERLASALGLLHNTTALIIDLRDNHGGNPHGVALLESYFFEPWQPRELNDIVTRTPQGFETRQFWTMGVPAALYYDRDVYVLTSSRTISAGEGFAYEMQAAKRATVVGEVTAGAANPANEVSLGDGFFAAIPFGRALNPETKTNWEGTGVHPDVTVDAAGALPHAYVMALRRAAEQQPDRAARLRQIADAAAADPARILNR
ncbi:MAG TPA: S41 family peptidase [Vicinamibacterales bacterium]|nr:S41 family peptidase [Vicinamibacterales bacterium]